MDNATALKIVRRQAPCPHDSIDTLLGNCRIWARCDNCGATIDRKYIGRAQESSKLFDDAIEHLRNQLAVKE